MKNLIMALFSPINPPKNYRLSDRNFDQEYRDMKAAYEKQQQKGSAYDALRNQKFEYNYPR